MNRAAAQIGQARGPGGFCVLPLPSLSIPFCVEQNISGCFGLSLAKSFEKLSNWSVQFTRRHSTLKAYIITWIKMVMANLTCAVSDAQPPAVIPEKCSFRQILCAHQRARHGAGKKSDVGPGRTAPYPPHHKTK